MANPITQIILTAVDKTRAAFASATGGMKSLGNTASNLRSVLGGVFAAISVGKFVSVMKSAIDEMDNANKAAQKLGTSVENSSALSYAAGQADVDVASLEKGMAKLARTLDDAKSGLTTAKDAFARLKIDPKAFDDPADALLAIADRFSKMPDGVDKAALALQIFGRAGADLIPLLNQGREGIQALKDEAARLGIVISTEAAEAAETFNDSLDKLQKTGGGLAKSFASELIPGLTSVSEAMTQAMHDAGPLKALWVALGGLGAALFTDDLLTNRQKLEKAQRRLNDAMEGGFELDSKLVTQLRLEIVQLKARIEEEDKLTAAKKRAREEQQKQTSFAENKKEEQEAFKKATNEEIKDTERLTNAIRTAWSLAIESEKDYLRQAKKLRDEANGTTAVAGDPESQASAKLDALALAMKLQRTAGADTLENVQDNAAALRDMAAQLEDAALKSDLLKQANLAEATALEKAAAAQAEQARALNEQGNEQQRRIENMKGAIDGIGKEVSVEIKAGASIDTTNAKLEKTVSLMDQIIAKNRQLGSTFGGLDSEKLSSGLGSLSDTALQYGRRK